MSGEGEGNPVVPEPEPVGLTANDEDLGALTDDMGMFTDVRDIIKDVGEPLPMVVDAAGLAFDALGFVTDPFGSLLSMGIGWLIEHIGFTKKALDYLAGDPDAITARANGWSTIAGKLDATAQAYLASLSRLHGFEGPTADAYRNAVNGYVQTVQLASSHAQNASKAMTVGGVIVGVARGMVKDNLSQYASDLIIKWTTASVLAPVSFGATEAVFITDAVIEGSVVAGKNAKKANEVITELEGLAKRASKSRAELSMGNSALAKKLGKHADAIEGHNANALKHVQKVEQVVSKRADLLKNKGSAKELADNANDFSKLHNNANNLQAKAKELRKESKDLEAEHAKRPLPGGRGERVQNWAEYAEHPAVAAAKESSKQVFKENEERQEKAQEAGKKSDEKWHAEGHLW